MPLGRRYAISHQATNTVDVTIMSLRAANSAGMFMYDLMVGSDSTPSDDAATYVIQRLSTPGAGTDLTAQPLDKTYDIAQSTPRSTFTSEPTYVTDGIMLMWMQNQRNTFRWLAREGGEIYVQKGSAGPGVGFKATNLSGSSFNTGITVHYME
jgi:hypothetical protein